ncbi:hypothetical protein [Roseimicrobium sp. ORNL1]|uniref:hypothetical protein n=1 Tax=Roseimicrobium sp. ORNL1 TaxID=2711231 RepID=UPI0013E16068|nr:hypothetical protein [Roseimicrobium sp. ORNL1]QIF02263.1 hypothetical protein G5S37_12245 [Roseimicrobium sp. ORNL1]
MKRLQMSLVCMLWLLLVNCKEQPPTTGREEFFIEAGERKALEGTALAGDMVSSERLYKYYLYCVYEQDKALYWLKIAEKNGSEDARSCLRHMP